MKSRKRKSHEKVLKNIFFWINYSFKIKEKTTKMPDNRHEGRNPSIPENNDYFLVLLIEEGVKQLLDIFEKFKEKGAYHQIITDIWKLNQKVKYRNSSDYKGIRKIFINEITTILPNLKQLSSEILTILGLFIADQIDTDLAESTIEGYKLLQETLKAYQENGMEIEGLELIRSVLQANDLNLNRREEIRDILEKENLEEIINGLGAIISVGDDLKRLGME